MKTKNKTFLIFLILISLVAIIYIFFQVDNKDRIKIKSISTFEPIPSSKGEHYLLYYPADLRTSQGHTIVKEVNKAGSIVREYEIEDKYFRRVNIHQKPNDVNKLYLSFFGEATIDNYYFTYDILDKRFNKINLDYFDYNVGVDHLIHYGKNTLFQTIVSHKTGEQNFNPVTHEFSVSISDYTVKKSFETEHGYVPGWRPLLEFNNKVIYGTSGRVNEEMEYENAGIGLIDMDNQKVQYESFDRKNSTMYPLYASDNNAYILADTGELFVYDDTFEYQTYHPFKGIPKQDMYYDEENRPLLLDEDKMILSVYSENKGTIVGILNMKPEPTFEPLQQEYMKPNSTYRFIYQDIQKKELYLLQTIGDKEHVLVIDNKTFDLKIKIPVENGYLIDFITSI